MPQFDTLTYFSQLFYVCLTFNLLYLALCYYLLPSIAAILKVRARSLSTSDTEASQDSSVSTVSTGSLSTTELSTILNGSRFDGLVAKSTQVDLITSDVLVSQLSKRYY